MKSGLRQARVVAAVVAVGCAGGGLAQSGHVVPLLVHAGDQQLQGFVRVVNRSEQAGEVLINAWDDAGVRKGPLTWSIGAKETAHFNSDDLERGNERKGISAGIGPPTTGDWRLVLRSALNLQVLAFLRTRDGFLTSLHDVAPGRLVHRVATFNPATNNRQRSLLRLINPNAHPVIATLRGVDDNGELGGHPIRVAVPAGASVTHSSVDLESGRGLEGWLGSGNGKWRLDVRTEEPLQVMNLLSSPTGHLTNLSTVAATPRTANGLATHRVPLFPAAAPGARQGFVRVFNRSIRDATVRVTAVDDAGQARRPVTLTVAAGRTVHFNSDDLENGNTAKGLQGVGSGRGDWHLELQTRAAMDVLAYIRTADGFLTSMHDLLPATGNRHRVAIFNPGGNRNQRSLLRLVNETDLTARVRITGTDDAGMAGDSTVTVTLPAKAARTISAWALETGAGVEGALGTGDGKWRLVIESDRRLSAMSLLESPGGHLSNLSSAPPGGVAGAEAAVYGTRVSEIIVQAKCVACHVAQGTAGDTRLVFAPRTSADYFSSNFNALRDFVRRGPGRGLLLAKARGDDAHGGGVQLPAGEQEYARLERLAALMSRVRVSLGAARDHPAEGGVIEIPVLVEPPPESPLAVRYRIVPDDDPDTADADAADFAAGRTGEVVIGGDGERRGHIDIAVADDDDIEHAREMFVVSLEPDPAEEYLIGDPSWTAAAIREGVCDRTPVIRDKLLRGAARADCRDVTTEDLSRIRSVSTGPLATVRGRDLLGLTNLESLTLCTDETTSKDRMGNLSSLPAELLAHTPQRMYRLAIFRCGISRLPDRIFAGLSLMAMHLSEPLVRLPAVWPEFRGGPRHPIFGHTGRLTLGDTRLRHLPAGAFAEATGLRELYIQDNEQIETVSPDAFKGLASLARLAFDDTNIDTLPEDLFAPLTSLYWLQFAAHQIRALPINLILPPALEYLNLNGNPLTGLPRGVFHGLSQLEDLRFEYCGGQDFQLPLGVFDGLASLRTLQMHGSGIRLLREGMFDDLRNLESIRLGANNISTLPRGLFDGLSRLKSIDLSGNPGTPFALPFELKRTDDGNAAPPPATVRVEMASGFPGSGAIDVAVVNGTTDATGKPVAFAGGARASEEFVVERAGSGITHVGLGPLPVLADASLKGVELRLGAPLVLFGYSGNRMPQATKPIPARALQVDGAAWQANMTGCFVDVDGNVLRWGDSFVDDPAIVAVSERGDELVFTPLAAGATTATVVAVDAFDLAVSQTVRLVVEPAPEPSSFDIDLDFAANLGARERQSVRAAADQWAAIVTGDLAEVPITGSADCADDTDVFTGLVDDLRISVAPLLELSNYAALASITGVREASGLPFRGHISVRPIGAHEGAERLFERTVLHEIGHVLGFSPSVWQGKNLFHNPSRELGAGADTHFSGTHAVRAFDDAGGSGFTARSKVPLHNSGASNSDVHWAFTELMDIGGNGRLSAITAGVFADLGYEVDASQAEDFELPKAYQGSPASSALAQTGSATGILAAPGRRPTANYCEVVGGPVRVVDRGGETVRLLAPAATTNRRVD